ncbi:MAG: hypothetical protein KUG49_02900 [Dokdonia sp.]|jgi:hypothetical protein|nr:hypothetical protein [Dokdonia sp.]
MLPNFRISEDGSVSDRFRKKGIDTYHDAVRYIHSLPYGRNRSPEKPFTIIVEGKGTCSTKHACLKLLAEENNINSIEFYMSIYAMDGVNTPGVGPVLERYNLKYIMEAHTYLSYAGERFDYTRPGVNDKLWESAILIEVALDADQIGDWKIAFHRSVLVDWIKRDNIKYSLDEIWKIREECLETLR